VDRVVPASGQRVVVEPVPIYKELILGEVDVTVPYPLHVDRFALPCLEDQADFRGLLGRRELVTALLEVGAIGRTPTVREGRVLPVEDQTDRVQERRLARPIQGTDKNHWLTWLNTEVDSVPTPEDPEVCYLECLEHHRGAASVRLLTYSRASSDVANAFFLMRSSRSLMRPERRRFTSASSSSDRIFLNRDSRFWSSG